LKDFDPAPRIATRCKGRPRRWSRTVGRGREPCNRPPDPPPSANPVRPSASSSLPPFLWSSS